MQQSNNKQKNYWILTPGYTTMEYRPQPIPQGPYGYIPPGYYQRKVPPGRIWVGPGKPLRFWIALCVILVSFLTLCLLLPVCAYLLVDMPLMIAVFLGFFIGLASLIGLIVGIVVLTTIRYSPSQ